VALIALHGDRVRAAPAGAEPTIRVLVFSTSGSATIATTGGFRVTSGGALLFESDLGGTVSVYRDERGLAARHDASSQTASGEGELTIVPAEKPVSVGGVWYPGSMRAVARSDGGVDLVSLVPLETYLEGVVPHEIGEPGPDAYAAVEAQAVAARTYAMSRMRLNHDKPYDVESGVMDQVYRGNEKRGRLTSSAVYDTRGIVLTRGSEMCDAYYSATCGGHTSDIRLVWPDRPAAPYLYGRLDRAGDSGSFCSAARNFRWRHSFSGRALGDTVRRTLPTVLGVDPSDVGELVDVRVRERNASGRVQKLEIVTSTRTFVAEGDMIRRVVMLDVTRGRILPSTLFDVETVMNGSRAGVVSFAGGGNGHGVGMCQNGAIGMARKGYSYAMILQHYYPGAELRTGY
jgi:stage II sporulation protein D